ncbi:PAS domain-containing sensor histidine kinase [Labilibacter marinus]|uniref:PAS domain-containing sensor histidine kinase n=1 Tax=Labilibacter marinus TaxID=1477105 RepID=UPI00094FA81C|nr:PAS domain S-box protein [Labilibacter marinus]
MSLKKSYDELEQELILAKQAISKLKANVIPKASALADGEAKFKAMMENVSDVIGIIDAQGITTYKSPNVEKVFGWKPEELLGKGAVDHVHPEDKEWVTKAFMEVIGGEAERLNIEFRYLKKDGDYAWVEFNLFNNLDNPYIQGLLINYRDISERKKADQDLLESEERFRMLFTNMDDTSSLYEVVLGEEGEPIDYRFLAINPVFEAALGVKSSDLKGKTLLEAFPKTEQIWLDTFRKAYKTGKSQRVEDYSQELDMYFEIIAYIPQEGLLSMIGVDITERKKAQIKERENQEKLKEQNEEYLAINEELNERNDEYSILNAEYKKQNEALLKAMDKAKESDILKSTFLQIMSHEIRTPMNAIYGFSELLTEPELDEGIRMEYSKIVRNSSEQLLAVVSNVLIVSSLETKQEQVVKEEVLVDKMLDELLTIFMADAKSSKLKLSLCKDEATNQLKLTTDRTKLIQILTNLIANAVKFTHDGEVVLGCSLKKDCVKFEVKDSGIGMSQEELEVVFEQFRQANKSIQKTYGGTGLGLTISKAFVELLGGTIGIESVLGQGTVVSFTLPLT